MWWEGRQYLLGVAWKCTAADCSGAGLSCFPEQPNPGEQALKWVVFYFAKVDLCDGCVFLCHSLFHHSMNRITHKRSYECRQNVVGMGRGDLLSRSDLILVWICGQFFTFLNIRSWAFYTMYCQSPDGDSAAALAEFVLCAHIKFPLPRLPDCLYRHAEDLCFVVDNYGGNSGYSINGYIDVDKCLSAEEQHWGESTDVLGQRYWLRHWVHHIKLGHWSSKAEAEEWGRTCDMFPSGRKLNHSKDVIFNALGS